ncbi:MAG TPA: TadE/TadG family type IV pilus assembly protein [Sphingomicrobium sp.]|jgi:Flp pilus assembly protein TadG|nr:TadE/TadG family type IV pilus assembly protein [Sphingomicrobium sp.]
MARTHSLSDESGSAAIEFAIAVPVLVMMIWGIVQVGLLFQANAAVQQALGEGARYATIYNPATESRPSDDAIAAKIVSAKFPLPSGAWEDPIIDSTNEAADGYIDITVEYEVSTDFLFFQGPDVTLTQSKRVYTQV